MSNNALIPVPEGYKAILVKANFSPDLVNEVSDMCAKLQELPAVQTQGDTEKVNTVLKSAKALMKFGEAERMKITSQLEAEKKSLIALERDIFSPLNALVDQWNKNIVEFQKQEQKKREEAQRKIQAQRDAELKAAQDEADRIKRIKSIISSYKLNGIQAANTATLATIDEFISELKLVEYDAEEFHEFLEDVKIVHVELLAYFNNRKAELEKLVAIEAINRDTAEKLKAQQEEEARQQVQKAQAAAELVEEEVQEALQNDVANIQMTSELKTSMIPKQKGIMERWVFDEETIDVSLLPLEFHTYDKAKIKEAIKNGAREIPGVVIRKEISNVSR